MTWFRNYRPLWIVLTIQAVIFFADPAASPLGNAGRIALYLAVDAVIGAGIWLERRKARRQIERVTETPIPGDFFDFLQTLTVEQWQYHTAYVYRLYPLVAVNDPDGPRYLRRFNWWFDKETIAHELGSGRYLVILTRESTNGAPHAQIRRATFEIEERRSA